MVFILSSNILTSSIDQYLVRPIEFQIDMTSWTFQMAYYKKIWRQITLLSDG